MIFFWHIFRILALLNFTFFVCDYLNYFWFVLRVIFTLIFFSARISYSYELWRRNANKGKCFLHRQMRTFRKHINSTRTWQQYEYTGFPLFKNLYTYSTQIHAQSDKHYKNNYKKNFLFVAIRLQAWVTGSRILFNYKSVPFVKNITSNKKT